MYPRTSSAGSAVLEELFEHAFFELRQRTRQEIVGHLSGSALDLSFAHEAFKVLFFCFLCFLGWHEARESSSAGNDRNALAVLYRLEVFAEMLGQVGNVNAFHTSECTSVELMRDQLRLFPDPSDHILRGISAE